MAEQPNLPNLPVPEAPKNPACQWCGERPAELYEVAPAIKGSVKQADITGKVHRVTVVKKRAVKAYACKRHRAIFNRRKEEGERRKAMEREARRTPTGVNRKAA